MSLSLKAKLSLLAIGLMVVSLAVAGWGVAALRQSQTETERRLLESVVQRALVAVDSYHDLETAGHLDQRDAQAKAMEAVMAMGMGKNLSLWIGNAGAEAAGTHSMSGIVWDATRDGQRGFMQYEAVLDAKEPGRHILYMRVFSPWDWMVGADMDLRDAEQEFHQGAATIVGTGVIVAGFAGLMCWVAFLCWHYWGRVPGEKRGRSLLERPQRT